MPEEYIMEILQRLSRIEQRLDDMEVPRCAQNQPRIERLEEDMKEVRGQVVLDRKVTVGVSAVTAAVLVALKWVFVK